MIEENVSKSSGAIPSTEGLPIHYDLYVPREKRQDSLPLILFLHGFKGFKDWGAFPAACARLSEAGFAVLAMNFSLNGVGESMTDFDQLELFARQTLSQDLDDVGSAIQALKAEEIAADGHTIDAGRLGVIGHSRGGHTAVAAAAEYPEIKCLVTWAAVADYNDHWSEEMISDWEENGITEIKNGRTGQIMPVSDVVYKDALEHADRLMAVQRVQELRAPSLFIHARGDEAVPYSNAETLFQHCSSEEKDLFLIDDSGHTFGTSHPFHNSGFPQPFKQVMKHTRQWFIDHLP